jgi:ubiquinone biosynthesis protein Coq4
MIASYRAYLAGAPLGDFAVLKLDAFSAPPAATLRRLEQVRDYAPTHDLVALRALPPETLGREYARFLDANSIEPLVISADVKERFRDNPYALRYTTTHDLHHVLTGFDTGLAGEAGAFAFSVGQGSAPAGGALIWLIRVLYAIISPSQAREVWHNVRVGLEMGRRAALLIAEPIESYFAEPLESVRTRLGIPDPRAAGVLPSGTSIVGDLIYPMKKKHA